MRGSRLLEVRAAEKLLGLLHAVGRGSGIEAQRFQIVLGAGRLLSGLLCALACADAAGKALIPLELVQIQSDLHILTSRKPLINPLPCIFCVSSAVFPEVAFDSLITIKTFIRFELPVFKNALRIDWTGFGTRMTIKNPRNISRVERTNVLVDCRDVPERGISIEERIVGNNSGSSGVFPEVNFDECDVNIFNVLLYKHLIYWNGLSLRMP